MTTPEPTVEPTALRLLAASQPDMVRASQKDEMYVEAYIEATREVVRRMFGPFRALQYSRESKLVALLLYHGLTTGLGQSTLGEEYCGMLQVAENGRAPDLRRRLLLVALLSAGPYAADRLANHLDAAAEEAAMASGLEPDGEEGHGEARERRKEDATAGAAAVEPPLAPPGITSREGWTEYSTAGSAAGHGGEVDEQVEGAAAVSAEAAGGAQAGRRLLSGVVAEAGPGSRALAGGGDGGGGGGGRWGAGWLRLLLAAAVMRLARGWRALVLAWPRARPVLSYAGRMHLALFYMYGSYYSLAHRLAGIRYRLTMRPLQGRPSYRVLGLLLGLQLAVLAALRTRAALRRLRAAAAASKRRGSTAGTGGEAQSESELYAAEDEPAVLLEDEAVAEWEEDEAAAAGDGGVEDGGREAGGSSKQAANVHAAAADSAAAAAAGAGAGATAAEGWERVEPHEGEFGSGGGSGAGSEAGWEADVFGLRGHRERTPAAVLVAAAATQPPAEPQAREVAAAAAGSHGAGWSAAADDGLPAGAPQQQRPAAMAVSRTRGGGRTRTGRGSGVLPVLTSLRQCPLCLSPKSHPTSTPCGHTFCWGCITTWCVEKAECPLCRAAVRLPELVALYHTNC